MSTISILTFLYCEFRGRLEWCSHVIVEPVFLYSFESLSTSVLYQFNATKNIDRPNVLQQSVGTNQTLQPVLIPSLQNQVLQGSCNCTLGKNVKLSFCRCELTLMDFVLDPGDQDLKEYTLGKKYMLLGSNFENIILKTIVVLM